MCVHAEAGAELDPRQRAVLAFWEAARGGLRTPLVSDLDPAALDRRAMKNLILAEYLDDAGLVRYRLASEEMIQRWGENFRGRRSDELFGGHYHDFLAYGFALARRERCPVYSQSTYRWSGGGSGRSSQLLMPFSAEPDGVPVRVLIVQVFPDDDDPRDFPAIRSLDEAAISGDRVVALAPPGACACKAGTPAA